MTVRRFSVICAVLLCLTAPAALAQDQPATKEEVLKLLETIRIKRQMTQYFDIVKGSFREGMLQSIRKEVPNLTEEQAKSLSAVVDELFSVMDVNEMLELLVPVYQKHFTGADIKAIVAFHESPTGKKLLDKQPEMMAEGGAIGQSYMQQKMPELERRVKARMETLIKELSAPKKD